METDDRGREEREGNLEMLREGMEKKLGEHVLQTFLEDLDKQEDYDPKSELQVDGIKLAFMVLKRNETRTQT